MFKPKKKKSHILKLTIIHLYTAPKGRGGAGGEKEREKTFVGNICKKNLFGY